MHHERVGRSNKRDLNPRLLPVVDKAFLEVKIFGAGGGFFFYKFPKPRAVFSEHEPHPRRHMVDAGLEIPSVKQDLHAAIGVEDAMYRKKVGPCRVGRDLFLDHDVKSQCSIFSDQTRYFIKRFEVSQVLENRGVDDEVVFFEHLFGADIPGAMGRHEPLKFGDFDV